MGVVAREDCLPRTPLRKQLEMLSLFVLLQLATVVGNPSRNADEPSSTNGGNKAL